MSTPFYCEQGKWGARVALTGAWSPAVDEFIRKNGIAELEFNQAKGWRGVDVNFLAFLPQIKAITIIDFSIEDIAGVHAQTHLKYLDLNTYAKTPINFSQFLLLEECSYEWNPKSRSLFDLPNLKKLFINKLTMKDFTAFEHLYNLQSLSLAIPNIESLQGIDKLKNLHFLGMYEARKLMTLSGINVLQQLETLEVNGCKKIVDISPLATLAHLRRLLLCNDGDILSLTPLADLMDLEEFLFYESTNVLDGNLDVLKGLPKLHNVSFMERKHYSCRRADF